MTNDDDAETNGADADADADLDDLLSYVHRARGFDFSGYKRASLARRVGKRMDSVGAAGFAGYKDYLEVHPDEFPRLFDAILINVTSFFRDPDAWEELGARIAAMVEGRDPTRGFRVWCAGCATGQEAYSVAMTFAEVLGVEQTAARVKIYATDVDEVALAEARQATYDAREVEALPEGFLARYFVPSGQRFVLQKEIRRSVIFGRHDLVQDAPISRIDLLVCRNTLMYLNVDTQSRVVHRFHFAVAEDGILFLGKAELLLAHAALFTPIDLKLRLFSRVPPPGLPARVPGGAPPGSAADWGDRRATLHEAAFEASPVAQLVVDAHGEVVLINRRAMWTFGLSGADLGRPFHDLELSYRPTELRSCIDRARAGRHTTHVREVERKLPTGETMHFDIEIAPLMGDVDALIGVMLAFTEVAHLHRAREELRRRDLDLSSAQEALKVTSLELEATTQELQSTVEELETMNEELQSTVEALETMNEELQSKNQALHTNNDELRFQGAEAVDATEHSRTALESLPVGIALLDGAGCVTSWNLRMEELWGLRAEEVVGKTFVELEMGLPLGPLREPVARCLSTHERARLTVDGRTRRGKGVRCQITVGPHGTATGGGAIVVCDDLDAP